MGAPVTLGIEVPDGDPGALGTASSDLRGTSGVLDGVAHGVRDEACVAGWNGLAALA